MSNPPGLYSRIKTWGSTDTILASDLNAEFDNVLSNFNPEMLAGYSQNVSEMQTQTAPGTVGTESLATSLAGELARLRYQINAITGNTYWYQTPSASLSQLNSLVGAVAFGNKINSGRTVGTTGSAMPAFLVASNSTNSVTLKATSTAFSYAISGTTYSIASDVTLTGLTVAPSSQNTATVNDLTLAQAGTASSQLIGENGNQITVSSMGTNITALVGSLAAFKTTASEYMIGFVSSTTQITRCFRGYFFNSSDALVSRGTLSNGDTLTLMKLAWIYVTSAGAIVSSYTNPKAGGAAPSSPASGDYWYDTSVSYWKTYNGTSWIQANATLIGLAITDTSNTVATRSFDFFESYSDLNTVELVADSQNSGTVVRSRLRDGECSVYGTTVLLSGSYAVWDFATNMDTGAQAASTTYYFYLDTNGKPFISKTAPLDRRSDLRGYYHPGNPWRCLGFGYSNALTLVDTIQSFYVSDNTFPTSNFTAANNQIILPYNIVPKETVITLTGANGAFTQVLPPPAQIKGQFLTYVRTDNTLANVITLQSWGTAVANPTGTISTTSNPTVISTMSSTASLAVGQLITGAGIAPNTTIASLAASSLTMSQAAIISIAGGTFNFANAAGYSGTVGQQPGYLNYGINGQFTTTLNTQYESVTITSDGYAYFEVNRRIPATWVFAGTQSIGATTTPGTKGTVATDQMWWRRVGCNAEIRTEYRQTAAGTVGSGDYLWSLPTNLTMDTNKVTLYTTIGGPFTSPSSLGICYAENNSPTSASGPVVPYSSTQVRFSTGQSGNGTFVGSAVIPLSATAMAYNSCFSCPILGWNG